MKCRYLNEEVVIDGVTGFNGNYKTANSTYDNSYSYYRASGHTDAYNTHFTIYPTGKGNGEFYQFHISLNMASRGIMNGKILYTKGKYAGFDDANLPSNEKREFAKILKAKKKDFDKMAMQFWTRVQEARVGHIHIDRENLVQATRAHVKRVKQMVEDEIIARPGITGVDIDYKVKNGRVTDELAIIVFVKEKKKVSSAERIPTSYKGVKTDIWEATFAPFPAVAEPEVEVGTADLQDVPADPLIGGVSVGPCDANFYGTLGVVVETSYGAKMMLSCAHVLASGPHTRRGDPESQPAIPLGGRCPQTQAGAFLLGSIGQPSNVDAALSTIMNRNAQANTILTIGQTTGNDVTFPGDDVAKFGRTTQFTTGKVASDTFTAVIDYANFGRQTYYNQIRIVAHNPRNDFALPGDSGAIVINEDKEVVAMVIGGGASASGTKYTIANPIGDVVRYFDANGIRFR